MIESVERADDPRIHDYSHVGDAAWLRANGLFVAEGRLVVQRLFEAPRFTVRSVLLTPAAHEALELPAALHVVVAPQDVLNAVTGFNFHRGCLALAERPEELALAPLARQPRLLALEGVGNPDNIGGLFRVAAALGAGGVLLDPTSGDPFYRKAIRTSMGTVLRLPFVRLASWPQPLNELREQGYGIIALTPRPDAVPIREFARDVPERFVLLAGAEGAGLSAAAAGCADVHVRIPMAPGVDSLNVSVAVGVALSHLV